MAKPSQIWYSIPSVLDSENEDCGGRMKNVGEEIVFYSCSLHSSPAGLMEE